MKTGLLLILFLMLIFSGLAKSQIVDLSGNFYLLELDNSKSFYDQGLVRKAEEQVLGLMEKYPDAKTDARSSFLLAQTDIVQGNFVLADERLIEFSREYSNSPFLALAVSLRSYIAFEQKNYNKATGLFDETISLAESDFKDRNDSIYYKLASSSTYWKGVALAIQGKYQEARPVFEKCAEQYPNSEYADDALFSLGLISEFSRQNEKAIAEYDSVEQKYQYSNSAISSEIRKINNYLIMRDAVSALIQIEKTEQILDHIIKQDSIGKLYEKQTNTSNAAEEILYLRLEAYNLAGNTDNSIASYEKFVKSYPNSNILDFVLLGAGWAYMKEDKYPEALDCYAKIISRESSELTQIKAAALLYRSLVLKKSGNLDQARKELSMLAVMPNFPYISVALLELGQIYYEAGEFDDAQKVLERAGREVTDANITVRISLLLGAVYLEMNKWDKAVEQYKIAEQIALKNSRVYMPQKDFYLAEARLKQGIALVRNHLSAEAITPLQTYLSDKDNATQADEAIFWLAEAYYRMDMLKNAAETYNSLLDMYPNSMRVEESLYGLGWTQFRLKDFKGASIAFGLLIKRFPGSKFLQTAHARIADIYYLDRDYKEAAVEYKAATTDSPKTEEGQYAAYQLCHALFKSGNLDGATSALRDFIRTYPDSPYLPHTLYLLGWIPFQQKKYTESIDAFKFLIARVPKSDLAVRAWYSIGDSYYNLGNYEKALEAYKTIIESFPSSSLAPDAMKSSQYCLVALGRETEAISLADSFIESNPSSPYAPEFKFKKAEMFYTGKNFTDAISEFNSFLSKYPTSDKIPEVLYWMGKSYISMNDPDNAEKIFVRLHHDYPKSDDAPNGLLDWGLMLKNSNKIQRADSVFRLLQSEYPQDQGSAQAGFERAVISYNLGDTLGSIKIFRETADQYSNVEYGVQSMYRVAMYSRFKKMNDSALVEFKVVAENQVDFDLAAESQYRIGEIYLAEQNYEAARDALLVVKNKFQGYEDWFSLSLLDLGFCYEKLDKLEDAAAIYQTVETMRENDDFGKTAKKRLKDLKKL